jgi:hypothetical protein
MDSQEGSGLRRSPWHIYPKDWRDDHWLVPYSGDNAVIHHGHQSPDDHSLCGPMVFCCTKSQRLFSEQFPESEATLASWGLTKAEHIQAWLEAGVNVVYFIFCDPFRPLGLLAGGLSDDEARQVLNRQVLPEAFADRATRLR